MYLHLENPQNQRREETYSDFVGTLIGTVAGLGGALLTEQNGSCPIINGGDCRKRKEKELELQQKQLEIAQQYLATRGGETNWMAIGLVSLVSVVIIGIVVWLYQSKK